MLENEGIQVQEVGSCFICGARGSTLYENLRDCIYHAPGTWSLLRCPKCGLAWLSPRPIASEISKLYSTYHTHVINTDIIENKRIKKLMLDSYLAAHLGYTELAETIFKKIIGRMIGWAGPIKDKAELAVMKLDGHCRGRLLDLGSGSGIFLHRMKTLGWEVVGVEVDPEAVTVARAKYGLNVYQGEIEEANFPANYFDAITLNHVAEHLINPMAILAECYRVLKPEGKLVITTPNSESLGARIFKKAWRGWEVPRHLNNYTTATLGTCAVRQGFRSAHLKTSSRSACAIWEASHPNRKRDSIPAGTMNRSGQMPRLIGCLFELAEYGLIRFLDVGEEIVLTATK